MRKTEIKRFIRLCGPRDRAILQDKTSARYSDLTRLFYISHSLNFMEVNLELYKAMTREYPLRLRAELEGEADVEEETFLLKQWVEEFHEQAPSLWAKKQLRVWLDQA